MIEGLAKHNDPGQLLVVCLCAEWCGVCRQYQERFESVRAFIGSDLSGAEFLWLDVEDEADLVYPLEFENFPTLLVGRGNAGLFFGPIAPQAQTLERMLRAFALNADWPTLADPALTNLIVKIRRQKLVSQVPALGS